MIPDLKDIEKKILNFWKVHNIFSKSLNKNIKKGNQVKRFNWFEGPPYTNAKPHMGNFLTRIYKDSILRFFTSLGFYAPRKAGWDTHGLPIEVATEKELGFKSKKDIYDYGIENFNRRCKELVTIFKDDWEEVDENLAFWVDHRHAYVTYDPFYIESAWWIIKNIYQKKLLKEEKRVAPYCPRCETVLAQAELGMPDAYKKVKDPSVFIMFKNKNKEEYFLVWTTTPWTLPGNLALAVNPNFNYYLYETPYGNLWTHQKLDYRLIKTVRGKDLEGISYEPLFKLKTELNENVYKIYLADFVKEDEGTGIVHIAPSYGEEDFDLGQKYNLPLFSYLDSQGRFVSGKIKNFSIAGKEIDLSGLFFKETDSKIIEYLKDKNLIFKIEEYEHDYPHCWRCKTPLIYYLNKFWVIKVSQIKDKIISANSKVNWIPRSVGNRFYEWIKEGKDWNLSRTRFWGIPLPIWKCEECGNLEVIGSLDELSKHFKAKNNYFLMRHCEALSNRKNFLSSYPEIKFNPLTRKGVADALSKGRGLRKFKIDLIFCSPLTRTKETADIIANILKVPAIVDFRLREIDLGILNNHKYEKLDEYLQDPLTFKRDLNKKIENGESFEDVRERVVDFICNLEKMYKDKNILIISHGAPLLMLEAEMRGIDNETLLEFKQVKDYLLGEVRNIPLKILPRNDKNLLDLHRPFVDNFSWLCSKCKGIMKRIEEIADIWFDSGIVPFASNYYPRRNKKEIDQEIIFPADFLIEGIDQTRGWFYTLLVISTILKGRAPYKNIISNGFVLDKFGKKMSKSLGNVIDPIQMMEKYGSDVVRFYLFYLNDVWENKFFNEDEVKVLKREFFDLILNVLRFYKFYHCQFSKYSKIKSDNILDIWFSARLKESYEKYYHLMKNFEIHKSSRLLVELLGDFSRWWLRRSRKRFQNPKNEKEIYVALTSFEDFIYQFLKMLSPLAPYTAEYIFQEIRTYLMKRYSVSESIHLETMGAPVKLTLKEKLILKEMSKIRELSSEIHRIRKEKQIKVRQPIKNIYLKSKFSAEVLEVLKEEVNVLNVSFDYNKVKDINEEERKNLYFHDEFILDLEIDEELKKIGIFNDLVRMIQDLRQEANLYPSQAIGLKIILPKILENYLQNKIKELNKLTNTRPITRGIILAAKETNYEDFGKIKVELLKI